MSTAARSRRTPLRTAPLALLAVAVLAGCSSGPERDAETGALLEAGDIDVFELRVGDCLAGFTEAEQVSSIRAVPCEDEHTDEVYAAIPLEEGGFPGDDAIMELANSGCYDEFAEFVGQSWEDSELDYGFMAPTEQSWSDGDREILCTVGHPNRELTGSLGDAGSAPQPLPTPSPTR